MEDIHIWDLPINKIYVRLDDIRYDLIKKSIDKSDKIIDTNYRRKAGKLVKILNKYSSNYGVNKINSDRVIFQWRSGECFMPLWVLIEMSNLTNNSYFSLDNLEKRITHYKARSGTYVIKSKFPFKINLEMVALYFHMFGDGCFSESNSTASYCQLDIENKNKFIEKLKNSFGEFNSDKIRGSKYSLIFPSIFAFMLKKIFEVDTFYSNRGRIPDKIKKLPYLLKFSGVIAFLIDEGSIDDCIKFSSSNPLFLKDFKELLFDIGFESNIHNNILIIKNKHVKRFYESYLELISVSPCCNLNAKEYRLKLLYDVNKRGRGHNIEDLEVFKDDILKILDGKKLRTSEIRRILFENHTQSVSHNSLTKTLKIMESQGILIRKKEKSVNMWAIFNNGCYNF